MDLNNVLLAADSARVQSGGRSIFEKVADAVTAGTAGAVVSGMSSIYNTAVYASNRVFGTEADELETGAVLGKVNRDWQTYYQENQGVIDTVGFIGGAFIPGGLAVKGLNLARAGSGHGVFRSALGYTVRNQEAYLQKGLKQIAAGGDDVFTAMNKNKLASMAFGAADNILQAAVFETAAAVAMHRAPTLRDETWTDISWDIAKTSLVGGLFGGGIEALFTNKIFRDAGKLVAGKSRAYDTLVALDKTSLGLGDKAFTSVDEILGLPAGVFEHDKLLSFSYRINGKDTPIQLNTEALFDRQLKDTAERGFLLFQKQLTDAVAGDTSAGAPLAKAMMEIVQQGKVEQKTNGQIKEKLGEYLFNLRQVQSLGATTTDFTKDITYLVPGANLESARVSGLGTLLSSVRVSSQDLGYRVHGDVATAKFGLLGVDTVGKSAKDAFEKGFDVVFSGNQGKVHVNPNSKIFRPIADNQDDYLRVVMNTRTKQVTDAPVATIADVADNKGVAVGVSGVISGKHSFKFTSGVFEPSMDSLQNSARHLWAADQKNFANTVVDAADFSLLDRLVANPSLITDTTLIRLADGTTTEIPSGFRSWVVRQKLEEAKRLFVAGEGELDTRLLALRLNAEDTWVQNIVQTEFRAGLADVKEAFRPLESYAARDNIVMVYKKPPIADPDAVQDFESSYTAYQHRKQLADEYANSMAHAVLGRSGERFLDNAPSKIFDATGAGPSFAGASNAGYFDPGRRWAQNTGTATHLTQQEFHDAALQAIQPTLAKLIHTGDKELGAVLQRVRFSEDRLSLWEGKLVDLPSLRKYQQLEQEVLKGVRNPDDLTTFAFKTNVKLNEDTYSFLDAYHKGHVTWLEKQKMLAAAQGRVVHWEPEALYLPPVDTAKVPFFALVRAQEGRVFSSTEVAMVTAKDAQELSRKVREIEQNHPDLQVILKDDSELFHKAKGDYDYAKGLNAPSIDPMLRKAGRLGDFIPTLETPAIAEEFVRYIGRREDDLVRSAVQVKYGNAFAELKFLSDQSIKLEKSKLTFFGKTELRKVEDPFGDYSRLALNISKRAEYTLWSQANEFVDAVGSRAYSAVEESYRQAKLGKEDWLEANAKLEKLGLRGVFTGQENYLAAQTGADRSLVKLAVAKGNMLLANIALRLDTANALINTISTPILLGTEVSAIRRSIKDDPALSAQFNGMFSQMSGDSSIAVPSTTRMIANAIHNYFGPEKRQLIDRYQNVIGSIRGDASQFHDMIADLGLTPNMVPSKWGEKVNAWAEKGAKWTGNNAAEQFTRFVSSDVMRQITQPVVDAGRMTMKEQNSFISIFVNRVQGNYISSQRPVMFQGTVGAAIGLFQTYQFNMFQQLFRHIEDRNGKTLAVAASLQSSLFGLNGLPLFDAVNTHLIGNANINEGHKDVYSTVAAADKQWGDFAMFGALSALPLFGDKAPALYTRGDLNPRQITIVPTSFQDIPIVQGFSRVAKSVWGIGNQVAQGGDFGSAMLHGLEHNGLSRPIAGLAQVMQGESTTSKGSIIAAHGDLASVATAARLLGAKPMDESVALNHKFRMVAYRAADRERTEKLGIVIKQKIRDGSLTEDDVTDFAARYAAAGGNVTQYGAAMQRWTKGARESEVNTIMRAQQTSHGQRMFEVMGGDPLDDLVNTPPEE